jgi:streptogramin lyase
MRLKLLVCGMTTLIPVLLLAGCGVEQTSMIVPNVQSPGITGRAMGGQQPVTGATIQVLSMGTSGYGSAGTVLSSTTTDVNGNFSLPAYTCPQSDTPVYLLGIGGNPGLASANPSAVEAVALGPCASAQQSYVIMNEVTTAATAFVFSHFFSTATPAGGSAPDSIGGPSTTSGTSTAYSRGMVLANNVTMPLLVTYFDGAVNQGGNGRNVDWLKINAIANILSACINSSGSPNATETKTTCGKLFNFTANGASTRPSDTLQAAVQMALHPTTYAPNLYALIGTTPPFIPYLSAAPNDWTISIGYTTSSLGLAVDTGTMSTLDIDSTGNIWFPSNGTTSGTVGLASFNPSNQTFSGPYNTTSLSHPQQVAIDANGYAWLNDSNNATVSGYLTTSPTLTKSVAFPSTTSQAVTIGADDRVNVGITNAGKYELANISADRTGYSLASGVTFAFPVVSMAGDNSDGDAVDVDDPSTARFRDYYVTSPPSVTQVAAGSAFAGQAIFTGNDHIAVRSYTPSGTNNEALCIYSVNACYNLAGGLNEGAKGLAIDGAGQLWLAESMDGGLVQVPVNIPANSGGLVYLNPNSTSNIYFHLFLHNGNDGDPDTAPTPYGIGVDDAGNVWMTNAGCTTVDCTPGTFTLTEVVGAAYPTITPVSAQITSGNLVATEPTY